MTFLQETGAYDNTLVVFTSDHGEQLGDNWQFAKYAYFDQSFHIPLIIRDPGSVAHQARGGQVNAFTESVDVLPTVLASLGLSVPSQCDGEALTPFTHGEVPVHWRTEAHWENDFRDCVETNGNCVLGMKPDQCAMNVIRGERYKYIHFTALPPLLFDLAEDPGEFNNLAEDPDYLPIVLEYAQKMLSWRMNHEERVLANTLLTPQGVVERTMPRR